MNIETREVRDEKDIPASDLASGRWVRLKRNFAKKYNAKQPVSDADYQRILASEQKRLRKQLKRLSELRSAQRDATISLQPIEPTNAETTL